MNNDRNIKHLTYPNNKNLWYFRHHLHVTVGKYDSI